jgi:hypothetical protein
MKKNLTHFSFMGNVEETQLQHGKCKVKDILIKIFHWLVQSTVTVGRSWQQEIGMQ